MTNLAALQSLIEYSNSNLFEKVLTDRGVVGSTTYTASNQEDIDLCLADIYMYLATHPEFKEGSMMTKYSSGTLTAMARRIYQQYGDEKGYDVDTIPRW